MNTRHKIYNKSSKNMGEIDTNSVDLVVTSPPYPMVEMWDDCFKTQNEKVSFYFENKEYFNAWIEMHKILDSIWKEVVRVIKPGGFVCINIGDATRTFDGNFQLFSNHSRIIEFFIHNGFYCLPDILWRKRTNAPNKFMGSGMLPAGAYVTFEHENILIFRKGAKRIFTEKEKECRQRSGYFYNERNIWFSDNWEIMGTSQKGIKGSRERSGAYPLEIPYRLINMYSLQNSIVLDPFSGLGTTMIAAMMSGRNSLNYELDSTLCDYMKERVLSLQYEDWNYFRENRLKNQNEFIKKEKEKGKTSFYFNNILDREVKTKQEQNIYLYKFDGIHIDNKNEDFIINYI